MLVCKKEVTPHINKSRSFYYWSYKVMILQIDKNLNRNKSYMSTFHFYNILIPDRSINRITQSITFLLAELSYKSVHRDFLAGLEEDSSNLKSSKYDAFRKLSIDTRNSNY